MSVGQNSWEQEQLAMLMERDTTCEISLCLPFLHTVALGQRGNQSPNTIRGVWAPLPLPGELSRASSRGLFQHGAH